MVVFFNHITHFVAKSTRTKQLTLSLLSNTGTFDVSILEISGGVFEVKATNGDTVLGGEDFDEVLLHHLVSEFKKDQGIDLSADKLAMQRLREAAEKCKRELDGLQQTEINLPFITADATGPKHLNITVARSQFEKLVDDLVQRSIEPCKKALKDSGIAKGDLADVRSVRVRSARISIISLFRIFNYVTQIRRIPLSLIPK